MFFEAPAPSNIVFARYAGDNTLWTCSLEMQTVPDNLQEAI